ncbi:MAG: CvpA family protein [Saprospiraceae bacterium]|nr:CvpA family protein [Saprospiraceae bacterium]
MAIDAIDIFFIVMASFGLYFGYTFGLMKVLLWGVSLALAAFVAMIFSPLITDFVNDTFNLESVWLPFVGFFVTTFVILLFIRILTKIIEEAVEDKRGNFLSQLVGAFGMSFFFTLLYCVLITFFGQAGVISLVLNDDVLVSKSDKFLRMGVSGGAEDTVDPIIVEIQGDDTLYKFFGDLKFGIDKHRTYFGGVDNEFDISQSDIIRFKSNARMSIYQGTVEKEELCFCDSTILVCLKKDSILFKCLDQFPSSQRRGSFLYQYIQVVPRKCSQLIQGLAPFVNDFFEYMRVALDRLGDRKNMK